MLRAKLTVVTSNILLHIVILVYVQAPRRYANAVPITIYYNMVTMCY